MSRGCEFAKQASDLQLGSSFATGQVSIIYYSSGQARFFFHFDKLLQSTIFVLSQANISTSACNQHLRKCNQHLRCADFFPQERYQITFRTSAAASAGETDRDLAATQFLRNCVAYNIIEF
jgi:hypothetical protein